MISGKINAQLEAVITVFVLDSAGDCQPIEAVIDTGFTGSLTLPRKYIDDLALRLIGKRLASLADGSQVTLNSYEAYVNWHDELKDVAIIEAESGPLIGMKPLEGSLVTLHVKEDGQVEIEQRP
ncbi:MAG: clan AA aspartic protease [Pirellulaceae bacterium]|nr:clan AA aspartic protease [Pirellulaceae bacterium]